MPIAESFIVSIAANLTHDLLKSDKNQKQKALRHVYNAGFQAMLRRLGSEGLSQAEVSIVGDVFSQFINAPGVAEDILNVALTGEQPDLGQLAQRFAELGDKLQGIRFDFERSMLTFLNGLTTALLNQGNDIADTVLLHRVTALQKSVHQILELLQVEELATAPPAAAPATAYHTCFISYATEDIDFAEQLYDSLRDHGVECWFAPEDFRIGDELRATLHQAIQRYDKLLIILSKNSINSRWVEVEVENAFARESKSTKLFPIRIDEAVMRTRKAWAVDIRTMRYIGDFNNWEEDKRYQRSLRRLLRDLGREG